jgi:hypothetical protein
VDVADLDHVTLVAAPGDDVGARLLAERGLGSFAGGYLDHLGARSHAVPLAPPHYLEWLVLDDPAVAAATPTGRQVLAAHDAGGGVLALTVLARDIDAVSARVGVPVYEGTTRIEATGTLRRWRTVTGPPHLPIFIAYDGAEARLERWRGAYAGVGHTCAPGGFTRIEAGGSAAELADWLGPHDLPIVVVDGPPGIRAAHVATANGTVVFG